MSSLTKLPRNVYDATAFNGFTVESGFTLSNGRSLIWLSQLAYETDDPAKIVDVLHSWNLRLIENGVLSAEVATVLPNASTHGFVAEGRGATFVAFAGTDPVVLANWVTDFDAHIKASTETAEGYEIAAEAIWTQMCDALTTAKLGKVPVYVTGHSLGGALAVLTALRIQAERVAEVGAVYTFGMPRAGSRSYADDRYNPALGERTYRLVNADDIVPTVVPSELGFHHVGRYLRCERGGKFELGKLSANTASDDPNFVDGESKELNAALQGPLSAVLGPLARIRVALRLVTGLGPAGVRTDLNGTLIELLPPRLQDHMPDHYINGF